MNKQNKNFDKVTKKLFLTKVSKNQKPVRKSPNKADSKLEALRAALTDGEESGDAGELDINAIRQEAKKAAGLS